MIIEFGQYFLLLGLITSLTIILSPIYSISRENLLILNKIYFIFITFSFLSLFYGYIVSDFSVINIIQNSHSTQPLIYKICGLWGNHEGSILLWCWVLAFYTFLFSLFSKNIPTNLLKNALITQSYINCFFVLFTFLTSNPFLKITFFSFDGTELNPILQDPGLIIHPPLLYLGYLGFSINFSLTISILLSNNLNKVWYELSRIFALISWSFLSFGILLGSWWAYYELGWGGWWFWDPVENAALMPWLLSTALLHTIIVSSKRNALTKLNIFLSIITFIFSLIGTFFVRSGLLGSVHSFATDSSRGLFILIFLLGIIIYSSILFFTQINKLAISTYFKPISKENGIFLNNILLIIITLTVMVGTFAPILFKFFFSREISIGAPFFNSTILPITIPFFLLMAIVPLFNWNNIKIKKSTYFFFIGFSLGIISLLIYFEREFFEGISLFVGLFLMISLIFYFLKIKKINGTLLAHFGVALLIIAITISSYNQVESIQILHYGDQIKLNDYTFILRSINNIEALNYNSLYGNFLVLNENEDVVTGLFPEKRFYFYQGIYTTKAAIHSNIFGDIYAIIGDGSIKNGWYTRFFYNPLMPYVWIGGLFLVIGGITSLIKLIILRNKKLTINKELPR